MVQIVEVLGRALKPEQFVLQITCITVPFLSGENIILLFVWKRCQSSTTIPRLPRATMCIYTVPWDQVLYYLNVVGYLTSTTRTCAAKDKATRLVVVG